MASYQALLIAAWRLSGATRFWRAATTSYQILACGYQELQKGDLSTSLPQISRLWTSDVQEKIVWVKSLRHSRKVSGPSQCSRTQIKYLKSDCARKPLSLYGTTAELPTSDTLHLLDIPTPLKRGRKHDAEAATTDFALESDRLTDKRSSNQQLVDSAPASLNINTLFELPMYTEDLSRLPIYELLDWDTNNWGKGLHSGEPLPDYTVLFGAVPPDSVTVLTGVPAGHELVTAYCVRVSWDLTSARRSSRPLDGFVLGFDECETFVEAVRPSARQLSEARGKLEIMVVGFQRYQGG
ncbi:hypothetical protein K438DRAFT_1763158 [Mycena galopus ATCC 62051]|nr:hypothetical protein K438DRAFT_1763158 [Mycena galopus ATCC 62051]